MLLLKEDVLDMFQFFLNNIHESVLFLISLFLVIAVSLIMVGIVCLGLAYFFEYLLPIGPPEYPSVKRGALYKVLFVIMSH